MLQTIFRTTMWDVVAFPFWWYGRGLIFALRGAMKSVAHRHKDLAIDIWLKNIFVPMYGQYDISGRIISFFMRFAQIAGRSAALAAWAVIVFAGIAAWIAAPILIANRIFFNL